MGGFGVGLGQQCLPPCAWVCVRLKYVGRCCVPPPHQVEVSRLESAVRSLHKQLGEAEADYLTGTQRLAQLHREVRNTHTRGTWGVTEDVTEVLCSNSSTRVDCLGYAAVQGSGRLGRSSADSMCGSSTTFDRSSWGQPSCMKQRQLAQLVDSPHGLHSLHIAVRCTWGSGSKATWLCLLAAAIHRCHC